ncbi:MAG TPA: type II toxin-antitoxin system VapC family toxin [Usitatibacter sp.]|nr:type II toxin-antitoxin system VapC family toxin [Usitatibacter sp.]
MIVVDSNVVAYCWIRGALTDTAQRLRVCDPSWHAPVLWRSELRSALAGYMVRGDMGAERATTIMVEAESAMAGCEHLVASGSVLEMAASSRLSAYDCEFVVLARALGVPLVTEDRAVSRAFPDVALTMQAFLEHFSPVPPAAHERSMSYGAKTRRKPRARKRSPAA